LCGRHDAGPAGTVRPQRGTFTGPVSRVTGSVGRRLAGHGALLDAGQSGSVFSWLDSPIWLYSYDNMNVPVSLTTSAMQTPTIEHSVD
jgi:hypothetical protein